MFARRRQKKRAKLAPNVVSEPDVVSDVIYVFTMGGPAATSFVCIPEPVGCLVGQVRERHRPKYLTYVHPPSGR